MKPISQWFGKSKAPTEKKSKTLGQILRPFINANELTAATSSGALQLYRRSSAVSIVVDKIVRQIKQLEPIMLKNNRQDVETSNDILSLLANPSPDWTRTRFMESVATNFLVTETSFIWAAGNVNRLPLEMAPINSNIVTVSVSADDVPTAYQVTTGPYAGIYKRTEQRVNGKRVVRYLSGNMAELAVIRGSDSSSSSGMHPESRLRPIQDEINQVLGANRHNLAMIANGGRLSLVFTLNGSPADDQFTHAEQALHDKFSGPNSAGSMAVVAGESTSIQEFGITPKDMDFETMQKTAILRVAQEYDIPGVLVLNDSATFNNMSEARQMMWDDAVFPTVRYIYEGLEDFLLMRSGTPDEDADLWFDELDVPALRMRRIEEIVKRKDINAETTNELRKDLGKETDIDGGDVIYQSATQVPLGNPVDDDPGRDIVKPEDDG